MIQFHGGCSGPTLWQQRRLLAVMLACSFLLLQKPLSYACMDPIEMKANG